MEQRVYHAAIDPNALAQHLLDTWDQDDTMAQALQSDEGIIVQVGQRSKGFFGDEPRTALTLALEPVSAGLRVSLGEQQWYHDGGGQIMVGGLIGFFPFFFTWPLDGGRDAPIDSQLTGQVWESVERYIQQRGAATGPTRRLTDQPSAATGATTRLPSLFCPSCGTENQPGAERCRECGTYVQARDCPQCGVSNPATANFCMRCGSHLSGARHANQ